MTPCLSRRSLLACAAAAALVPATGGVAATALAEAVARFPRAGTLLAEAARSGKPGQIYCSLASESLLDLGFGETGSGEPVTGDTLVPWASAVKPTTCAAIMRLADAGRLSIDDHVTDFIPEFGQNGKEEVRIRHLLTHTAQLGGYNGPLNLKPWDEEIAAIIRAPRESAQAGRARVAGRRGEGVAAGDIPPPPPLGTVPSYNPAGIWILGEILRRVHGVTFPELIRSEVYLPCGMTHSWCGMSPEIMASYGGRILRGGGRLEAPSTAGSEATPNPAGGGLGPSRDLARFYEVMLSGGVSDGARILREETVREMTRVHASDGGVWTFGLGFNINAKGRELAGSEAGRLRYGKRPSEATFGHNGATGVVAFADPRHRLALAMIGLPQALADALYEDLGLA